MKRSQALCLFVGATLLGGIAACSETAPPEPPTQLSVVSVDTPEPGSMLLASALRDGQGRSWRYAVQSRDIEGRVLLMRRLESADGATVYTEVIDDVRRTRTLLERGETWRETVLPGQEDASSQLQGWAAIDEAMEIDIAQQLAAQTGSEGEVAYGLCDNVCGYGCSYFVSRAGSWYGTAFCIAVLGFGGPAGAAVCGGIAAGLFSLAGTGICTEQCVERICNAGSPGDLPPVPPPPRFCGQGGAVCSDPNDCCTWDCVPYNASDEYGNPFSTCGW